MEVIRFNFHAALLSMVVAAPAAAGTWATFTNCAADPGLIERVPTTVCAPAELPEASESGEPALLCRSERSPKFDDLQIVVYDRGGDRVGYVYNSDDVYQKTIVLLAGADCTAGIGNETLCDATTFVFDPTRQRPTLVILQSDAEGRAVGFKIYR